MYWDKFSYVNILILNTCITLHSNFILYSAPNNSPLPPLSHTQGETLRAANGSLH